LEKVVDMHSIPKFLVKWVEAEKLVPNFMMGFFSIQYGVRHFMIGIFLNKIAKRSNEMADRFFLYDDTEVSKTRFVSFVGENNRFDLALVQTGRHYGKTLVLDMQGSRFAIIGEDDLKEEGYLEFAFKLSEEDAEELRSFLAEVI